MLDGWKRPAALAMVVLALAIYTFVRPVPEQSDVDRLERRLADHSIKELGERPPPLTQYVRYYANVRPKAWKDLTFFTTIPPTGSPPQQAMIAGVLVRPGIWEHRRIGAYRVPVKDLPSAVHGGCRAVNVLYDPREDEIVGAWCNIGGEPRTESPNG